MNNKETFKYFALGKNIAGSGKAPSYIKAIDLLCDMIEKKPLGFVDCSNVWEVTSVRRLKALYDVVLDEKKKGNASAWNITGIPKSYLQNGFCSAALKLYMQFINEIGKTDVSDDIHNLIEDKAVTETEKSSLINARVGQGRFRTELVHYWGGCALTGYRSIKFLVASHIKPWRAADNAERLDKYNGILLLPNLDKAFDLGYISFSSTGNLLQSEFIDSPEVLGIKDDMKIKLDSHHQNYLDYHRENVFRKTI